MYIKLPFFSYTVQYIKKEGITNPYLLLYIQKSPYTSHYVLQCAQEHRRMTITVNNKGLATILDNVHRVTIITVGFKKRGKVRIM
jgi:hypothetical protein